MTTGTVAGPRRRGRAHYILRETTIPRAVLLLLIWAAAASVNWPPTRAMWVLLAVALVAPHLLYWYGTWARYRKRAALFAFVFDLAFAGLVAGYASLSPVPALFIMAIPVGNTLLLGGPALFLASCAGFAVAAGLGAWAFGYDPTPDPAMVTVWLTAACVAAALWATSYGALRGARSLIAAHQSLEVTNRQVTEQSARLERALREIRSVNDVVQMINSTPSLERALNAIQEELQLVFDFNRLGLIEVDATGAHLRPVALLGAGFDAQTRQQLRDLMIPFDDTASSFVHTVTTREPVYIPKVVNEAIPSPNDRMLNRIAPSHSFVAFPVIIEDDVVGAIYFGHDGRPFELTEKDIRTIGLYVDHIAVAVRNARLLEEAQAARAKAEQADRSKSQFLANMSHELRTPMNAIIGYSELLAEEARDAGAEQFVGDLVKIQQAGTHLLDLINGVLDLSKIEADKMELYLEEVDVSVLLDAVASTVAPLMDRNRNRLEVQLHPELGVITTDAPKLRQTLLNLLSNAAKFTEDGVVTLSARMDAHADLMFEVHDTGIGIAPEVIEQLFKPFAQGDASTTRKYGGTGLGLAISQRFCRMLGGAITLESEPGLGSTFTVRLPRLAAVAAT